MSHSASRQLSRRSFTKQAVAAATMATAISSPLDAKPTEYPKGKYVDIHVHLGQRWNSRGELSPKMMLDWMDANEIAQAAVLSLVSPEAWFYQITPEYVLKQTEGHRDRLLPWVTVDPRTLNLGGRKGIADILQRYKDAGAVGFGEHKWGGPIDDPRNMEVFHGCSEVGLPVLFHMDNSRNMDQPGLPGLEKVLKAFPNVNFIGHAQGWWGSISGNLQKGQMSGYPKGPVVMGGAIDRLMEKYPNIYGDLSAGSGANAISRDVEFGRSFLIRRADRILFGTDYLMVNQRIPQFKLHNSLDLPEDVQAKIFRDNARRLMNI